MLSMFQRRPLDLTTLVLSAGGHKLPPGGTPNAMCVNEAAAWLAGEPFSDAPACVDPAIRRLTIRLNALRGDIGVEARRRLVPYVERIVGTSSTDSVKGF